MGKEETVLGGLKLGGNVRYPTKAIFVSEHETMRKRHCLSVNLVCTIRFCLPDRITPGRQMQNMISYCHEVCIGMYIIYNGV